MDLGLIPACCTLTFPLSAVAASILLANAKTGCMQPANMQSRNLLHLGHSRYCVVEVLGYNDCYCLGDLFISFLNVPASVAQLDARPTGDQEFAGLTSPVGDILSCRMENAFLVLQ